MEPTDDGRYSADDSRESVPGRFGQTGPVDSLAVIILAGYKAVLRLAQLGGAVAGRRPQGSSVEGSRNGRQSEQDDGGCAHRGRKEDVWRRYGRKV